MGGHVLSTWIQVWSRPEVSRGQGPLSECVECESREFRTCVLCMSGDAASILKSTLPARPHNAG